MKKISLKINPNLIHNKIKTKNNNFPLRCLIKNKTNTHINGRNNVNYITGKVYLGKKLFNSFTESKNINKIRNHSHSNSLIGISSTDKNSRNNYCPFLNKNLVSFTSSNFYNKSDFNNQNNSLNYSIKSNLKEYSNNNITASKKNYLKKIPHINPKKSANSKLFENNRYNSHFNTLNNSRENLLSSKNSAKNFNPNHITMNSFTTNNSIDKKYFNDFNTINYDSCNKIKNQFQLDNIIQSNNKIHLIKNKINDIQIDLNNLNNTINYNKSSNKKIGNLKKISINNIPKNKLIKTNENEDKMNMLIKQYKEQNKEILIEKQNVKYLENKVKILTSKFKNYDVLIEKNKRLNKNKNALLYNIGQYSLILREQQLIITSLKREISILRKGLDLNNLNEINNAINCYSNIKELLRILDDNK